MQREWSVPEAPKWGRRRMLPTLGESIPRAVRCFYFAVPSGGSELSEGIFVGCGVNVAWDGISERLSNAEDTGLGLRYDLEGRRV